MPKMKTNKAMKSRFKVTASGKIMRHRKGKRHILTKKSSARKRRLSTPTLVSETLRKKYLKMMGEV